jgi:ubiquinone/menaquinone biosynthesis C-methylase UbiE
LGFFFVFHPYRITKGELRVYPLTTSPGHQAPENLAGGVPASSGQLILERRARLVRPLLPAPCGHLVDFGCGNGAQTLLFTGDCERVTGVDVNEDFLGEFRREIVDRELRDRVEAVVTGGGPIPLPDGSADVVTSFTVLEHVPDEQAALEEMYRVLRPGGKLIITVPNRWWIFETHGADLPLLPWNRVPLVSWWPKKMHDRWARARIYRRREIEKILVQSGFRIEASFRMTAPMDMISWEPLRRFVRSTMFATDRAPTPFQATEIVVAATR